MCRLTLRGHIAFLKILNSTLKPMRRLTSALGVRVAGQQVCLCSGKPRGRGALPPPQGCVQGLPLRRPPYWAAPSTGDNKTCGQFLPLRSTTINHNVINEKTGDAGLRTLSLFKPRTTSDMRFSSTGSPCVLTTQPGRGGKLLAAKSNLGGDGLTSMGTAGL